MNWEKCIICQTNTKESLQCPANSKRKDAGVGYSSFIKDIKEFEKIGVEVPLKIDCELDNDISKVLVENKASWHKSCRDTYNNTKLQRAKKRQFIEVAREEETDGRETTDEELVLSPIKSRRSSSLHLVPQSQCFFCGETDNAENLHCPEHLEVNDKVKECAYLLNDNKLIAKLSDGDMIAIEARYHARCLVSLYNKARPFRKQQTPKPVDKPLIDLEELAFAELISYIDEYLENEEPPAILVLSDLVKFYASKLEELGVVSDKIHATRLKMKILESFPDLTAHSEGREVQIISKHDIGGVLSKVKAVASDAQCLARAAQLLRKEILKVKNSFNGTFSVDCQKTAVPKSLLTFIGMMTKGSSTKFDPADYQGSLTIAQLTVFNTIARSRDRPQSTSSTRHVSCRECPLPIYLALKIHSSTRDRSLIDTFYSLGQCISYDKFLSMSTEITNSVVARYEEEGVVCPPKLEEGLFTTGQIDNCDHNTSATSAQSSFHGTAITIIQNRPDDIQGKPRGTDTFDPSKPSTSKTVSQLPSSYTEIPPIALLGSSDLYAPQVDSRILTSNHLNSEISKIDENDWLKHSQELVSQGKLKSNDFVSWAAFRASKTRPPRFRPAIISLLPMFSENSHSHATIAHSMNVVKAAVKHLNPSQTPVITLDQPLFALAKEIQWKLPAYSEQNFVLMLGGLHIEMASLKMLGKWLAGSGWTDLMCNAGVATQGVAESFLTASHISRTRRAHQVTTESLFILLNKAYNEYAASAEEQQGSVLPFHRWQDEMKKKSPQFLYWLTVSDLELMCLRFVRSIREANFLLYIDAIEQILPWMFAMDHPNYARWLTVHYRDMRILKSTHPEVFKQFSNGCFVVHKTSKLFSSIALDHAHEQENAVVKGDGSAVGITENPAALRRWMVGGPELSRMVNEFERSVFSSDEQNLNHHEQTPSVQCNFLKDVQNTVTAFEELGNPFMEETNHLLALHTRDIMDNAVVDTVKNAREIGDKQFKTFIKERLVDRSKPITDPIVKNNLPTLNTPNKKSVSKDKSKIAMLKNDCALFSHLYIACQVREGNLNEFFKYENQPWPPSLSLNGQLRGGQKADLTKCLSTTITSQTTHQPTADAVILDGAVIVQMLQPGTTRTFQEYFTAIFAPYIHKQLETANRVDIVWDVYHDNSLKKSLRIKRGSGQRRNVLPSTRIPKDWKSFLRVDENKDELFKLLANKVVSLAIPHGKVIFTTYGEDVLTTEHLDTSMLAPCSHEEADTRLMLHVLHAATNGCKKIKIRSNDTDVIVLAISVVNIINVDELWITHGQGKNIQNVPAHDIAMSLGVDRASSLPLFHALTGCDTVSYFGGRGKKTAWDVWKVFPQLTTELKTIITSPESITEQSMDVIERFVVLLYDRTSGKQRVNDLWSQLFTSRSRTIDNIPPTQAALHQHIKRAVYQGAYVWGQTLLKQPTLPCPSNLGWCQEDSQWTTHWSSLPQAKDTCYELIKCGCKTACKGRCKCLKANLVCTALCKCGGNCKQ